MLGVRYGAIATPATLMLHASLLPPGAHWAAFGIGRWEFPMLAQAWLLGGHVRVGLEDNIYLEKGVLAPDNTALVAEGGAHPQGTRRQDRHGRRGARDPVPQQVAAAIVLIAGEPSNQQDTRSE